MPSLADDLLSFASNEASGDAAHADPERETGDDDDAVDARRAQLTTGATLMCDVRAELITWLIVGFLALRKLTNLSGDPDRGKSTLTLDWAARLSRGEALYGGPALSRPRGTVLLAPEDGAGDTIRPRLEAAGADLSFISLMSSADDGGGVVIPTHIKQIERNMLAVDAALLVVDPIVSFLPLGVSPYSNADVRRALNPLVALAERTDSAIVIVQHLNKRVGATALHRAGGSGAFTELTRSALVAGVDPTDDEVRLLASSKGNLSAKTTAIRYELVPAPTNREVAVVRYLGRSETTADQMLGEPKDQPGTPRDTAKDDLVEILSQGMMEATEIMTLMAERGHKQKTIMRAKDDLGIESKKLRYSGVWNWRLPDPSRVSITPSKAGPHDAGQDEELMTTATAPPVSIRVVLDDLDPEAEPWTDDGSETDGMDDEERRWLEEVGF